MFATGNGALSAPWIRTETLFGALAEPAGMQHRSDVAPSTLPVSLEPEGVFVEYLDGRDVFYHGPPEARTGAVRTRPGTLTQVLVTDEAGTEGVMVYVNDFDTHDDVLEESGVGRLLLGQGESDTVFPGVRATRDGHAVVVEADPSVVDGRVFVFAEDELGESAYELVADEDASHENDGEDDVDREETAPSGDPDR